MEPASNKNDNVKLAKQAFIFALLGWPTADLAIVVGLLIAGTVHASTQDWLVMLVQVGVSRVAGLLISPNRTKVESGRKFQAEDIGFPPARRRVLRVLSKKKPS